MKSTIQKSFISLIFISLFTDFSYCQLNYKVLNYNWTGSSYIQIYFEVENEGEHTQRISDRTDVYLFDNNNYQYSFLDDYFSIDVYPHRKVNISLTFSVRSNSENIQLGFGSSNSTVLISKGYEYDKDAKEVIEYEQKIIKIQNNFELAILMLNENKCEEVLELYRDALHLDKEYTITNYKDTMMNSLVSLIKKCCENNDYDNAWKTFQFANYISENEIKFNEQIDLCSNKYVDLYVSEGDLVMKNKNYEEAIINYKSSLKYLERIQQSLDINRKTNIENKISLAYDKLGDNYFSLGKYRDALNCYKKSDECASSERIKKKIEKCYKKL